MRSMKIIFILDTLMDDKISSLQNFFKSGKRGSTPFTKVYVKLKVLGDFKVQNSGSLSGFLALIFADK